jgi:glycosyltransferase involved in cell wall biosynthesis
VRIAQVAPLYESVPPQLYGGTERIVSYLTEELVRVGHEVTLFASGDSTTNAELVPLCERSLRLDPTCRDRLAHHLRMVEEVAKRSDDFDVVHYHIDYLHYPISRREPVPQLTTLHGRLDLPELAQLYDEYRDMPVVSISDAQRAPLPQANWLATVHHGLPIERFRVGRGRRGYLAFIGRTSPEKGLPRAIEIAQRAGLPLRIAAKVDDADRDYFRTVIEPLLESPDIDFVGEIGEGEKSAFFGGARALLFPIDWPEPFGLVLIESLACGTPVIAYPGGSVEELLCDGRTGFVVDSIESAVEAVGRLDEISRAECRREAERRFSVERMTRDYVALYKTLAGTAGAFVAEEEEATEEDAVSSLPVPADLLPERSH